MKLHDLHEERLSDYMKRLVRDLNIKTLGSGYYSTVFQHPVYHNVSVKITREADPHHVLWLREAEKHQHNPWFPKIIGIHKVMFHNDEMRRKDVARDEQGDAALEGRHIIFMQKLRPMTRAENMNTARYLFSQLPSELFITHEEHTALWSMKFGKKRDKFEKELKARGVKFFTPIKQMSGIEEIYSRTWRELAERAIDKDVRELASVLVRVGTDDLHNGNIMMRDYDGVKHPVITDPVASPSAW